MDISVSSNFERFLFHCTDDNATECNEMMNTFKTTNKIQAIPNVFQHAQKYMASGCPALIGTNNTRSVRYQRGFGGEEKENQAVAWFEKAVHKGNTSAMYVLGNSYDIGDKGLTQSATKAIELFLFFT